MNESTTGILGPQAYEIARVVSEVMISDALLTPAYAATINTAVSPFYQTIVIPGTLTGNTTIANPTNPRRGQRLTYVFTQDGTGGRTITWGSAFKAAANGNGTAGQKGATTFVYDGTNWQQESGALTFK